MSAIKRPWIGFVFSVDASSRLSGYVSRNSASIVANRYSAGICNLMRSRKSLTLEKNSRIIITQIYCPLFVRTN